MNSALALVNNGVQDHDDPIKLLEAIPNIVLAIELAQTPDEISGIRSMVKTFQTYLKETLPGVMADRNEIFTHVHKTGVLFLEASAKAGAIWQELENKETRGRKWDNSANSRNNISWHDAGFKSDKDVTRCVRAAELDEADRWQYYEECRVNSKEPTMNGIENVWREFYRPSNIKIERILLPDTFNVIYADPPWQYNNTGVDGAANHHYPTMPLEDIATLPKRIGLNIADNAVLFMWVTNPFLQDALSVISAWRFEYKTNMVWVKTELKKPGSGFYVRGRHELLFICTRGSFTPLNQNIAPPIGSVLVSPVDDHSRKPTEIYDIIESLYPECHYIELFSRSKREKWVMYGNELPVE